MAQEMYSKRDLSKTFSISHNTVIETLKACGLSTSKRFYSEEEVLRFRQARSLLDSGGEDATYEAVSRMFSLKNAAPRGFEGQDNLERRYGAKNRSTEASNGMDFINSISEEIEASVNEVIVSAIKDLIPHIPQMAASACSEVARTGLIREAFQKYRDAYLASKEPYAMPGLGQGFDDKEREIEIIERLMGSEDGSQTDSEKDDEWIDDEPV